MNRYSCFVFVMLASFATTLPAFGQTFFTAKFSAEQEPGDVASTATGTAVLAYGEGELSYFITVEGLTGAIAAAHFHNAEAGVNGDVVKTVTGDFEGTTATGVWSPTDDEPLTADLVGELFAGNLYLNVHTAMYPGGEIRAQIVHTDGATLTADLTSEQQPNGVTSPGRGTAVVQLSEAGAAFYVTVDSLTGPIANAHFHGAQAGVNGGVVRGILSEFDGNTAIGLWTPNDNQPLTDSLFVELLKGNLYLNVHTGMYPAGEIRGQLNLTTGWAFQASLDPEQEPDGSSGTGYGTAAVTFTTTGLVYDITVTDLTGDITGAHFHNAPAGTNGPVIHPITDEFVGNTASGFWPIDDEGGMTINNIIDLFSGELYLNVHTMANQGGELRGQVLPAPGTAMAASLTPEQEPGEIAQEASGTAFLSVFPDRVDYELTIDNLSGEITGSHFHRAGMGANGNVVKDIAFTGNHSSGSWTFGDASDPLTDELRTALLLGELYLNVHTMANPGGEIRGQVFLSGGTAIRAQLTSEQEPGNLTQGASGTAAAILTDLGLTYQLTVENLSGPPTAAHFHDGAAGVDGGVVQPIEGSFSGNTASGFWPSADPALSPELRNALIAGNLYVNVHTAVNGGGELRGQTRLASGIGSGVEMSAGQQPGTVVSDGRGTAALNLSAEGVTFDITVDGLTGPMTNAHFHNAPIGVNGGVVRGIFPAFQNTQTAFGVWRPNDGEPFSVENLSEYITGNLYLNVHTDANPGGEIRGQIGVGLLVATAIEQIDDELPQSIRLSQNYPNPFNPSTTIEFDLTGTSTVRLDVFNVLGQRVRTLVDSRLGTGSYRVTFDAGGLPSGLYTYRLDTGSTSKIRKMLLVR